MSRVRLLGREVLQMVAQPEEAEKLVAQIDGLVKQAPWRYTDAANLESIRSGQILENYPEHRRGPCCLLLGYTGDQRPLHVVSTTAQPVLVLITVYEPKPPKWVTPTQRRLGP